MSSQPLARNTRHRFRSRLLQHRPAKDRGKQTENVVPMINIIFLLLLYFMVAGNLDPDFSITLPEATRNAASDLQHPTVYVASDGTIRFERRALGANELRAALADKSGSGKLKIHADAAVDALTVSNIMDLAAEVGIVRFILVTRAKTHAP